MIKIKNNMSEYNDQALEARLDIFHDHIKRVVEKRKDTDGTAQDITDVAELTAEDERIWNIYLKLLHQTTLPGGNNELIQQEANQLTDAVKALQINPLVNGQSRKAFLEWMVNRLTIIVINLPFLSQRDQQEEIIGELKAEWDEFSR
ncbi:MAG: hypothetical protein A3I29_04770 [Candidatus Magasanikbacteria bacterium RIFCSPLOWO2_02_FULL_44_11]|uniref:Uncharacterized protein n=2 Tax=Candidatus Magasanikiibacteriota TaxID=1752731 RepID=A0A1F6N8X4_9BACT|nr:MAG: hypothetical protein A3D53_00405 [Candidatus Magasanikbacteria bacterium RIFCSPHIGHO2_02_FULL_45_10]OGH80321.1 MAG: hypothetical protein A3I29_04770 [Candidatus Magasanikbacteria bacterium RIFCSPLOWO2_02_FULL_44_11]